MNKNSLKPIVYSLTATMKPVDNPCFWCGGPIPENRRAGTKFCSNSHKQMHNKRKHELELENDLEEFSEEPEVPTNDNPRQDAVEMKSETQQLSPKVSEIPIRNVMMTNIQRHALNMKCRVTAQLERLVEGYIMYKTSSIPRNEVHAILPTNYRLDNIGEINLGNCTLRYDVNKKEYLICKNKSL